MNKMLNKIILAVSFFMYATISLVAQDGYEYASVKYVGKTCWGGEFIYVSINGKDLEKIEAKGLSTNDDTQTLNYVAKMVNEGWRVIQTTSNGCSPLIFVLERKKQ